MKLLRRHSNKISSVEFKLKFGFLTRGIATLQDSASKHYSSFFLLRRLGFMTTLFVLISFPRLQLVFLLLESLLMLTYLIRVRPFLESHIHALHLINEVALILLLIVLFAFTFVDIRGSSL